MKALPKKKSAKSHFLAISFSLIAIVGGGMAAWFSQDASAEASMDKRNLETEKPPTFVALDPFTVNLHHKDVNKFLQISFTVQVSNEERMTLFKSYMPEVRSRSILLFSSKEAADISTIEGKHQLAREIQEKLNEPFKSLGIPQMVSDVYFTSFLIQ